MKESQFSFRSPLSPVHVVLRLVLCLVIGSGNYQVFAADHDRASGQNFVKIQKYFDQQKILDQRVLRDLVATSDFAKKAAGLETFILGKAGTLAAYKKTILESGADQSSPEVAQALAEISRQAGYYAAMMRDLKTLESSAELNDFADQLAEDSQSAFFFELFMIFSISFVLAVIFTPSYYYTYTPVTVIYDEKAEKFYYYRHRRIVYI